MSKTLKAEGFPNLTCLQGDQHVAEVMEKFKKSNSNKRILLLNSRDLAAGTNLQCASHVVFLEPAGDNKAAALSIETQAIGRYEQTLQLFSVQSLHSLTVIFLMLFISPLQNMSHWASEHRGSGLLHHGGDGGEQDIPAAG